MSSILKWTQAILKVTPNRWNDILQSVPHELLTRQPQPGEWSALEVLQHMIDTEAQVFSFRVQAFLDGKEQFPAFSPDEDGSDTETEDYRAMGASFAKLREESLHLLGTVKPEHLGRKCTHQQLGAVTLEEMLYEWGAHDLNHLVQAERAIMQPFIYGSGPWRSLFADHDVEAE